MRDRVKRYARDHWPALTLLLATTALFAYYDMFSFLTVERFAGRDLVGNYAYTWLVKQTLLDGHLVAWTNQYLLGFPVNGLYPPLFFVLTAGLDLLTGTLISLRDWFAALVFASVFLLPLVTYRSFRPLFSRLEAFFIGAYTLYFLFVYPPVSQAYQVMSVGLVAQGFAFLLLIPAATFLLRHTWRSSVIAGVLLGLTVLAHPFVGVVAGILAGVHLLVHRDRRALPPVILAGAIVLPWLVVASRYLPYTETYTLQPAMIGTFTLLLLPLIVIGGLRTITHRTLLLAFGLVMASAVVELPVVQQEVRFFTYALGIGALLAGSGAHRIVNGMNGSMRYVAAAALLLPVIALSLQAGVSHSWRFDGNVTPLHDELRDHPRGRVLVESVDTPLSDAYVLQESIPMETKHRAVNELHMDASPSANYILTLEHWLSTQPLQNPLCDTCNTTASPALIDRRLDDLGVRYVVTRTRNATRRLQTFLNYQGIFGDYGLFTNPDAQVVDVLSHEPVALVGRFARWRAVNDRLFVSNLSVPIVWLRHRPAAAGKFSSVVTMRNRSIAAVMERLGSVSLDRVRPANASATVGERTARLTVNGSRPVPVRVAVSYMPTHRSSARVYASNYHTVLVFAANRTRIEFR